MRVKNYLFRHGLLLALLWLSIPVCAARDADRFSLSPQALQAARIIGIEPLLNRLSALAVERDPAFNGLSLEELSLHQQITEAVVVASLDIDLVADRIDNERAQIVELQGILLARRQRALGTTNLATLALSTGLGAISGVLQFSDTTKGAGNAIGFAAGGLSTLLSFHSLRQQHSGSRPGWVFPNMLAPFFSEPAGDSSYPSDIWAYLNAVPEGPPIQKSVRERLLAEWSGAGRFAALESVQAKAKIALLTTTDASDKRLNMDLLSERAAMLADVREEVSLMKLVLAEILREIRVPRYLPPS